jgi:pyruvate,orthophosphate dikinase
MNGVYSFEEAARLGLSKFELGGKGYGLVEMCKLGLPVPSGFIISTECCRQYFRDGKKLHGELKSKVVEKIRWLEEKTGKGFGDPRKPLLVSVRSGAPISMPGMMDTILNLGVNDIVVEGLAKATSNAKFAYEVYSRFIYSFGKLVMKIPGEKFGSEFSRVKVELNSEGIGEDSPKFWERIVESYKKLMSKEARIEFPQDPYEQLFKAIAVVFDSWWNPRAATYRKVYKIGDDLGTAVIVMEMVYGNYNEKSATGVVFTRNPSNGVKELYGEYLVNAQGEELVSGVRTPKPINKLKSEMPKIYKELEEVANKLEKHFKDMQDIEFTVEDGKLYVLQTRTGKRTATASVKIAVDMVDEGLISKEEAIARIDPSELKQLFYKRVDPNWSVKPLARGLPASPGVAAGKVVFKVEDAIKLRELNEPTILVRQETTPEDIAGTIASEGLLTTKGGLTSHAAVVTRGLGKPCVVGCESIKIDLENELFIANGVQVKKGELITIDGLTGNVYLGEAPVVEPKPNGELEKLILFSDEIKKMEAIALVNDAKTMEKAALMKADGFMLMNIESVIAKHMDSILDALSLKTKEEEALEKIENELEEFFQEIFRLANEKTICIKLLSQPLKDMLPSGDPKTSQIVREHPEANFRGVRLMLTHPEFYEIQLKAIFNAALKSKDVNKKLEIGVAVPFVSDDNEAFYACSLIEQNIKSILSSKDCEKKVSYKVGAMIQTPRGILLSDEIAKHVDFLLIDFDELTTSTFSLNRDEIRGGIFQKYLNKKILAYNPYETIDLKGIGKLIEEIKKAKESKQIRIGAYYSYPESQELIEYLYSKGFDYLITNIDSLPIIKLLAAKAYIKHVDRT